MHRINAAERLQFISDLAAALSDSEEAREHKQKLTEAALCDDEEARERAIILLHRRNPS